MIAAAPIHFTFAVVFLAFIGWWVLRFFYRERLASQTELLGLYKDKFGPLIAEAKSPLARLRTRALRKRAGDMAAAIDHIADELNLATDKETAEWRKTVREGGTPNISAVGGSSVHFAAVYDKQLKVDAILIRTEIRARLNAQGIKDDGARPMMGDFAYERPTNPLGYREVASDLKRISKLLP